MTATWSPSGFPGALTCTHTHHNQRLMAFHVYVHDCGCIDYVDSFSTRAQALAYANQLDADCKANPTHWDLVAPWFEISNKILQARETYDFTSMSGVGQ